MLSYLAIRDFAIIDRLEVEFERGFSVLTGETGAGKSILVNALHLLLGGRASPDMIRTDAETAEVQAVFELGQKAPQRARLQALDMEAGDELCIRRVITRAGRNRIFVNDKPLTLAGLTGLCFDLLDISGQHEHVGLTDEDNHRGILDAFGALDEQRIQVGEAVRRLQVLKQEQARLLKAEQQRVEREEYLRFALERIDDVSPETGEDGQLSVERMRLRNVEKLASGMAEVLGLVYEKDGAALEQLGVAHKTLDALLAFDPELGSVAEGLAAAMQAVQDAARELESRQAGLEAEPDRLEWVEQRLADLKSLMRVHGPALEDVLTKRQAMAEELDELGGMVERRKDLAEEVASAKREALALARDLSKSRQAAARELAGRILIELKGLAMAEARFAVEVVAGADEDLDETGLDRVRFMLSANPGEQARPLARVASGGELSRVLLAVKAVLAEADPVASYVFDEVDTGVGGAVGDVIGDRLKAVSKDHQVLCITHLGPIAAAAEHLADARSPARLERMLGIC
ncbi:MAG: DNA repair protein RecN [Deltaproteobacteria bacterium]|nr:DNA repair protein RecN [Deltaproteobacteria bacterium]